MFFPSAIGRWFYENVFPSEQVELGWCSYAAVWLSRVPALIPGHFVYLASPGEVCAAFNRQPADDWRLFLSLRAQELRAGGRLVVVLPGLSDAGASGFEPLFNCANAALEELAREGIISDDAGADGLGHVPATSSAWASSMRLHGNYFRTWAVYARAFRNKAELPLAV